ncbi:MAG: protoglobin domain-containing protein [Bacillota bacterium]
MSDPIPGYVYGTPEVAHSPLSDEEFDLLKQSVMFNDEDERYLRMAGQVLDDQIEDILDLWYEFIATHPHLLRYFSGPDGSPDPNYLSAVRQRFGQWIRDTCSAHYGRAWLDYQQEIALRHTPDKKGLTDHVQSWTEFVPLRYVIAFIYPITATIRQFLAKKGHSPVEVDRMYHAWFKSVTMQVALWSQPYMKEGLY